MGFLAAICAVALAFPCATASALCLPVLIPLWGIIPHIQWLVPGLPAAKLWLSKGDRKNYHSGEVTLDSHYGFKSTSFCGSKRAHEEQSYNWKASPCLLDSKAFPQAARAQMECFLTSSLSYSPPLWETSLWSSVEGGEWNFVNYFIGDKRDSA